MLWTVRGGNKDLHPQRCSLPTKQSWGPECKEHEPSTIPRYMAGGNLVSFSLSNITNVGNLELIDLWHFGPPLHRDPTHTSMYRWCRTINKPGQESQRFEDKWKTIQFCHKIIIKIWLIPECPYVSLLELLAMALIIVRLTRPGLTYTRTSGPRPQTMISGGISSESLYIFCLSLHRYLLNINLYMKYLIHKNVIEDWNMRL